MSRLIILTSYYNSVEDPSNELVYLYEVWEALKRELGKKADRILNIPVHDRKQLEKLACKNLKQGRHRGRFLGLRDATAKELDEARSVTKAMIIQYLQLLETSTAQS